MNSLKGKIALMTASGQGIGFATAKAFAKAGAHVIATDINEKTLNELSKFVAETHVLDVTDKNAISNLLGNIEDELNIGRAVSIIGEDKVKDLMWFHPKEPSIKLDPRITKQDLETTVVNMFYKRQ